MKIKNFELLHHYIGLVTLNFKFLTFDLSSAIQKIPKYKVSKNRSNTKIYKGLRSSRRVLLIRIKSQ